MNTTKITDPTGFKQHPWEKWPADCQRLLQPVPTGGNPFGISQTPWMRLCPSSLRARRQDMAVFLDWLMRTGRYDAARPIAEQMTKELATAYDDDMAKANLGFYTRSRRLNGLYAAMRELTGDDNDRWRWLQVVGKECERLAKDNRELPAFMPLPSDLIDVAVTYLRRSAEPGLSDRERAILFRDGTLVIFFTLVGSRRGAVQVMLLNEHLKMGNPTWIVEWPPENIKGRRKGDRKELPDILVAILRRYLAVHRPVLLKQAKMPTAVARQAVWLSERGTALCCDSLYKRFRAATKNVLKVAVNPHSVRHAGATFLAVKHPELVHLVQPWLGHTTSETGQEFYNLADTLEDSRRFVDAIDRMRFGDGEPMPKGLTPPPVVPDSSSAHSKPVAG